MRSRFAALLPVLLAVLVGLLAGSASAASSSFVSWANTERAAAGRAPYAVRSDLTAVAQRHAQRMAERHAIWHNPNLRYEVDNYTMVGENVGMGNTERAIHDAFMASPTHRSNILDRDFTEIGVGVVVGDDGNVYVVQVFRRPASATAKATASAPAPAPAARTTPAVRRARPAPPAAVTRPAPSLAQVIASHRAPTAGALPKALAYTNLLGALASAS